MLANLEITSVGPPPERHADRVVAEMMRHLARQHAHLWATIEEITKNPRVRDGNPRAQRKVDKAAGAHLTNLEPGKRGRYHLFVHGWVGWDAAANDRIKINDPIPDKPWFANWQFVLEGTGHCGIRSYARAVLYVTHHSLSRVVQRWQVKTLTDLTRVIDTIGAVALTHIAARIEQGPEDSWFITPPDGIRVPFPNNSSVMILKQHEKRKALIVATIF
jgi:hypothetical protein